MNKSSIRKNFFKQLNSELPNVSGIDLPKKKSERKAILLSTLIPATLVVVLIAVLVPILNRGIVYKDNSKLLNKITLGEASINNINKYTAIGVGKLEKDSLNKKYRLITNDNNDEVDDEVVDLSNTLIGLTTEGVLEELSLTIQNGQQLDSSKLTVTYYEELGDFVLISLLPMNANEYLSNVVGRGRETVNQDDWNQTAEKWDKIYKVSNRECVSYAIDSLVYPLRYSIRYYDSTIKDYKYIDTSYLIHKRSGKIFPISSRKYCVNPKKCQNGEFYKPSVIVDDEEEVNEYPVNSLIEYTPSEVLIGYDWIPELGKPMFYCHSDWSNYTHHYFNSYCNYHGDMDSCFPNGFFVTTPTIIKPDLTDRDNQVNDSIETISAIRFDEESLTLNIGSIKALTMPFWFDDYTGNEIYDLNNGDNYIRIDRYGNLFCKYRGRNALYNMFSGELKQRTIDPYNFDLWTKQFYEIVYGENDQPDYFVFLNSNLEEEYRIRGDYFTFGNYFDYNSQAITNTERLDNKRRLTNINGKTCIISLNDNWQYDANLTPTVVLDFDGDIFYRDKDCAYYMKDLVVHKVTFHNNNLLDYEDTVFVSLQEYPYITEISMIYGVIKFKGMNGFDIVEGYVYPDGTISFEVIEFEINSSTTTLSPIN